MAGDNFPYKNHDSRVWENGEVVMKFTQIYVYIYIYIISNAIIVPFYSHHIPLNPYLPRYLDLYSTLRCHQLHGWKIHHGSTWGISQCQAQMWLGGFPGFPMSPWRLEVPTIYDNCLVVEPPMVDIMVNIWLI